MRSIELMLCVIAFSATSARRQDPARRVIA
jgi:hypothetical protein